MSTIEQEIEIIKERNRRVEKDKAWERSGLRVISVSILTYAIVSITLIIIDAEKPFLGALIPVLGFYLSTRSLFVIRKWWERK